MIKLYKHDIEQSVLSTLMSSEKAFDSVGGLHAGLFIDDKHKVIFECIERLKKAGKGLRRDASRRMARVTQDDDASGL